MYGEILRKLKLNLQIFFSFDVQNNFKCDVNSKIIEIKQKMSKKKSKFSHLKVGVKNFVFKRK